MDFIKAILLGIIEGLTEFIPVSSTGHLIVLGKYLEFNNASIDTFNVFIQLGAILAVVVLYFKKFLSLLDFNDKENGFSGKNGILKITFASLPILIIGFFLYRLIKGYLFGNTSVVAVALIVGGIIMIFVENKKVSTKILDIKDLSFKDCFIIGLCQCFSLCPGFSRSASTIIGGMLLGAKREIAAEFSFIVAVPVISAAVFYDLLKNISKLSHYDIMLFLMGFFVSFIVSIFAMKFFLQILKKFSLKIFGYYRILLGILILSVLLH